MEEQDLNTKPIEGIDTESIEDNPPAIEENTEISIEENVIEATSSELKDIDPTKEAELIYSIIESAVPKQEGFRRNLGKRDFALWVLPILAINRSRRDFKRLDFIKPFNKKNNQPYEIKGDETIYTNTKNIFEGKETMRFFGFRFISIWVFPIAITGAVMEFLFVGPMNGTNPFG